MLYLLYGSDVFRRDARIAEIRTAYRKKHPEALGEQVIDAEDTAEPLKRLAEALTQGGGLFDSKSLVIARGLIKRDAKGLQEILGTRSISEDRDTVLLLVEEKLKKAEIKDFADATDEVFDTLPQSERVNWIGRYVKEHAPQNGPGKIQKSAATTLAGLGDDLGRIAQELERLMAYAAGEETIREEHIAALLPLSREETIFPISDGVAGREPAGALAALAALSGTGDDARGLLSYALKEARQMIRAHAALSSEIPGDPQELFGAKPFVWKKRTTQARKWTDEEIRDFIAIARDIDASSKRGNTAKEALEELILRAAQ